ncbi:MAG: response regulator [Bacteroidota bacterium]
MTPEVIFYTDDDEDEIFFFRDAVADLKKDIELKTHQNGDDLITALLAANPLPSLVFLDLNMPGKSGFDVLKEIREIEAFADLPVIIFSTSTSGTSIDIARMLGANLYMPKPNSFSALQTAIAYSLSVDWTSFDREDEGFFYNENLTNKER